MKAFIFSGAFLFAVSFSACAGRMKVEETQSLDEYCLEEMRPSDEHSPSDMDLWKKYEVAKCEYELAKREYETAKREVETLRIERCPGSIRGDEVRSAQSGGLRLILPVGDRKSIFGCWGKFADEYRKAINEYDDAWREYRVVSEVTGWSSDSTGEIIQRKDDAEQRAIKALMRGLEYHKKTSEEREKKSKLYDEALASYNDAKVVHDVVKAKYNEMILELNRYNYKEKDVEEALEKGAME